MRHIEIGNLDPEQAKRVWEVSEYCRKAGVSRREEQRLIKILGRYASAHELQMNIVRPNNRSRC
ncbi:hypothetical protein OCK02_04880 (plasmid) [Rhizobium sp. TRM96647]|uniref:hypothetical protein n=1 Tax=Rhizobiaceae TaxID=82115 RepID=UPI000DD687D6|nr:MULTISPECIES: hypothetical protein [Rhizobiaceae]MCD2180799.1 hypothetical protein [Rhizobium sp. GN54]MCV3735532.1 hypothetical protein [Rhizobium sp. TRM96647]MCV3757705.1 hypothetical protein [Rhizobium sp. TRM96650]MDF1632180.1 hypothetical protein [Mycoplana sp. MJR14]